MKPNKVIAVADGFWNVRATMKVAGLLDIGTHASLVRLEPGRYVFLDACQLDADARAFVDRETGGGGAIEAVLHLHPFHTLSVRSFHALYPQAKLHGTSRHALQAPELPWQAETTDDPQLHARYADHFDFTVPRGVDFVPKNESLHFSSVLALHRASQTLHVDDTLNYVRLPGPLRMFAKDVLSFHPTLARVLEPRAGAASDFRAWARELVERMRTTRNLCAAHRSVLLAREVDGPSLADRVEAAARKIEPTLAAHERRFG